METIYLDRANRTRLNNNIILSKNLIKLYNSEDWNLDYNWFGSTIENYTQNPISGLCENYLFLKNNQFYNYNLKDKSVNEYDNGLLPIMDLNIKKNKRSDTEIIATDLITNYNSDDTVNVKLIDNENKGINNAKITITINNKPSTFITKDGIITVPIKGMKPGKYNVMISFNGDENYKASNTTVILTINKLNTRLYAPSITTTYNIAKNLIISLKDYQGKSLNGKIISMNNKKYKTDKKGQVKIPIRRIIPCRIRCILIRKVK